MVSIQTLEKDFQKFEKEKQEVIKFSKRKRQEVYQQIERDYVVNILKQLNLNKSIYIDFINSRKWNTGGNVVDKLIDIYNSNSDDILVKTIKSALEDKYWNKVIENLQEQKEYLEKIKRAIEKIFEVINKLSKGEKVNFDKLLSESNNNSNNGKSDIVFYLEDFKGVDISKLKEWKLDLSNKDISENNIWLKEFLDVVNSYYKLKGEIKNLKDSLPVIKSYKEFLNLIWGQIKSIDITNVDELLAIAAYLSYVQTEKIKEIVSLLNQFKNKSNKEIIEQVDKIFSENDKEKIKLLWLINFNWIISKFNTPDWFKTLAEEYYKQLLYYIWGEGRLKAFNMWLISWPVYLSLTQPHQETYSFVDQQTLMKIDFDKIKKIDEKNKEYYRVLNKIWELEEGAVVKFDKNDKQVLESMLISEEWDKFFERLSMIVGVKNAIQLRVKISALLNILESKNSKKINWNEVKEIYERKLAILNVLKLLEIINDVWFWWNEENRQNIEKVKEEVIRNVKIVKFGDVYSRFIKSKLTPIWCSPDMWLIDTLIDILREYAVFKDLYWITDLNVWNDIDEAIEKYPDYFIWDNFLELYAFVLKKLSKWEGIDVPFTDWHIWGVSMWEAKQRLLRWWYITAYLEARSSQENDFSSKKDFSKLVLENNSLKEDTKVLIKLEGNENNFFEDLRKKLNDQFANKWVIERLKMFELDQIYCKESSENWCKIDVDKLLNSFMKLYLYVKYYIQVASKDKDNKYYLPSYYWDSLVRYMYILTWDTTALFTLLDISKLGVSWDAAEKVKNWINNNMSLKVEDIFKNLIKNNRITQVKTHILWDIDKNLTPWQIGRLRRKFGDNWKDTLFERALRESILIGLSNWLYTLSLLKGAGTYDKALVNVILEYNFKDKIVDFVSQILPDIASMIAISVVTEWLAAPAVVGRWLVALGELTGIGRITEAGLTYAYRTYEASRFLRWLVEVGKLTTESGLYSAVTWTSFWHNLWFFGTWKLFNSVVGKMWWKVLTEWATGGSVKDTLKILTASGASWVIFLEWWNWLTTGEIDLKNIPYDIAFIWWYMLAHKAVWEPAWRWINNTFEWRLLKPYIEKYYLDGAKFEGLYNDPSTWRKIIVWMKDGKIVLNNVDVKRANLLKEREKLEEKLNVIRKQIEKYWVNQPEQLISRDVYENFENQDIKQFIRRLKFNKQIEIGNYNFFDKLFNKIQLPKDRLSKKQYNKLLPWEIKFKFQQVKGEIDDLRKVINENWWMKDLPSETVKKLKSLEKEIDSLNKKLKELSNLSDLSKEINRDDVNVVYSVIVTPEFLKKYNEIISSLNNIDSYTKALNKEIIEYKKYKLYKEYRNIINKLSNSLWTKLREIDLSSEFDISNIKILDVRDWVVFLTDWRKIWFVWEDWKKVIFEKKYFEEAVKLWSEERKQKIDEIKEEIKKKKEQIQDLLEKEYYDNWILAELEAKWILTKVNWRDRIDVNKLNSEIENLQNEVNKLTAEVNRLKNKNENQIENVNLEEIFVDTNKGKVAAKFVIEELGRLKDEEKLLREEKKEALQLLNTKDSEIKDKIEAIQSKNKRISQLQSDLSKINLEISKIEEKLRVLKEKEKRVENSEHNPGLINNYERKISEYQRELDELNSKKRKLEEKLEALKVEMNRLERYLKILENDKEFWRWRVDRIEDELKKIERKYKDLKHNLNEAYVKQIEKIENQKLEYKKDLENLINKEVELENKKRKLEELRKIKEDPDKYKDAIINLRKLTKEQEKLQKEISELNEKIKAYNFRNELNTNFWDDFVKEYMKQWKFVFERPVDFEIAIRLEWKDGKKLIDRIQDDLKNSVKDIESLQKKLPEEIEKLSSKELDKLVERFKTNPYFDAIRRRIAFQKWKSPEDAEVKKDAAKEFINNKLDILKKALSWVKFITTKPLRFVWNHKILTALLGLLWYDYLNDRELDFWEFAKKFGEGFKNFYANHTAIVNGAVTFLMPDKEIDRAKRAFWRIPGVEFLLNNWKEHKWLTALLVFTATWLYEKKFNN